MLGEVATPEESEALRFVWFETNQLPPPNEWGFEQNTPFVAMR
jgi:hypothetical protein